jgi:single-strand DNA-binding protein
MADINNITLTGRLGQDPEMRFTPAGKATASVSLAVSGFSKDKTDWVRLVFWEKSAEILNQFVKKGDQIGVVGRLQVRDYQSQDGTKRTATEVAVSSLTLLGGKKDATPRRQEAPCPPVADDELPY